MAGGLMFINSDARTVLSVRQKEVLDSQRRSHAARISHERAHRVKAKPKPKPKRRKAPGLRRESSSDEASSSLDDSISIVPWTPPDLQERQNWSMVRRKNGNRNEEEYLERLHDSDSDSLVSWSSVLNVQPATTKLESLSKIYWHVTALSSAKICAALRTKPLFNEQWLHLLQDDAFYHVGSALVKHEYSQLVDPTKPQPEIVDHKLKAMRIIRKRIEIWDGILDNPTLLAILFLPALEDIFPVNKIDNVHWIALGKLVNARLRVRPLEAEPFGPYTVAALDRYRSFVLVHHGIDLLEEVDRPRNPILSPMAPPVESSTIDNDVSVEMPVGFRILQDQNCIGEATTAMVCNLMTVLEEQKRGTFGKRFSQLESPDMSSNFANKLGSVSLRPSSIPGEPSIENVIPDAVTLCLARVVAGPLGSINIAARSALVHLVAILPQCTATRTGEEENALFWAWTVGIESLKTRIGELSSEGLKLRDMFARRFPRRHQSRMDAKSVLERFFCDEVLWSDYQRLLSRM